MSITLSSISPTDFVLALLFPSIAFPKPIERRPHLFETPCRIAPDSTRLCLSPPFLLSMATIRPSSARSLERGDNREPVQCVEFNVILSASHCTSSSFFCRRRCEQINRIFPTTRTGGGRVKRDPGFRERQRRREIWRGIGVP